MSRKMARLAKRGGLHLSFPGQSFVFYRSARRTHHRPSDRGRIRAHVSRLSCSRPRSSSIPARICAASFISRAIFPAPTIACGRNIQFRSCPPISPLRVLERARASPIAGRFSGFARDNHSEFTQAGIESFGRPDLEAADAEILALALDAAGAATMRNSSRPLRASSVRIGDAGLFSRLLEALDLPPQWRRRIARGHSQGKSLDAILSLGLNGTDHSGVLGVLEGADKQGARALVEDLLSIAGMAPAGGRSPGEIADRFLEQAALKAGSGLSRREARRHRTVLARRGRSSIRLPRNCARSPADAKPRSCRHPRQFRQTARVYRRAGARCRQDSISARALPRNLDYYTGFVFEAHERGRGGQAAVGGGRYDQLPQTLGAETPIPAIGAAIWIDRLSAERGRAMSLRGPS